MEHDHADCTEGATCEASPSWVWQRRGRCTASAHWKIPSHSHIVNWCDTTLSWVSVQVLSMQHAGSPPAGVCSELGCVSSDTLARLVTRQLLVGLQHAQHRPARWQHYIRDIQVFSAC